MVSSEAGTGNGSIAERWRELQGEHSWNGLLDPLDLDLRKSLISYGELVSATGYGFNKEKRLPHYGLCMYGHDDLLIKSGVAAASHYSVTKFVYATAEFFMQKETTWMGYVAVATDEGVAELGRRDIVVAWRGTLTFAELINDLLFLPVPAEPVLGSAAAAYPSAKVHMGFLSVYTASNASSDSEFGKTSARDQVLKEVRRLVELYKDEETSITVVGHSLGGSLSILNAVDLISNGVNKSSGRRPPCPVTAVVFACPHVGNKSFKDAFDSFNDLKALHVKNSIDRVPGLPPWLPDLGVTLPIDTKLSPYLKDPDSTAHELECYLHGVAGVQGSAGGFNPVVIRDVALVNKGIDALKDDIAVPASWWVAEHKSMVKNDKGKWELKNFEQINLI